MVLAPESKNLYRLLVIGKKSLPEIRESEARSSERYRARVGGIFDDHIQLTNELLSKEFREGDMARPVREGKYAIVDHNSHTELAFVLELPRVRYRALWSSSRICHEKEISRMWNG